MIYLEKMTKFCPDHFFPDFRFQIYIFYKHKVLKNIIYHNPATFDKVFNKWSRHTESFHDVKKQSSGGVL